MILIIYLNQINAEILFFGLIIIDLILLMILALIELLKKT